ncbi:hypothetical protein ACWDHW_06095 [Streptomyces melanosporofaciens]
MSIILEKPAQSEAPDLTITVPMTVDRDMLAYALDAAVGGGWGHPDDLDVEFIREYIGAELSVRGWLEVEQDKRLLRQGVEYEPGLRPHVEALYRAIDRAFPELAPAVTS